MQTGDDFGQTYWRAAAGQAGAALCYAGLDDATFRLVAEHLPTLCSVADASGQLIWLNRRWYEYCGSTPAAMQGEGWRDVHDPALFPEVERRWAQAVSSGAAFEMLVRLRGADDVFRPFLARVWPLHDASGKPKYWLGVASDIGAQLAAEAALRAEGEAHAALIAAQQRVAAAPDLDTMLEAVVQGAMAVSPLVHGAAVALADNDVLAYRAAAGFAAPLLGQHSAFAGSLAGLCIVQRRPLLSRDTAHDDRADRERAQGIGLSSMVVVPVFRRDEAVGVLKLMSGAPDAFGDRDIAVAQLLAGSLAAGFADAAEARAARALRESEARFQDITNAVDPMIWSASPDGRTDFYNARWYEFVGVPKGASDVDLWTAVLHPDDWGLAAARWSHSVATGEPFDIEYRLRHHSGEYRWALGRATLMRDTAGQALRWYGTCTDIHDRRVAEAALRELNETLEQRVAREVAERAKAEAALRQSQKMEAVGQLTGGIAHDFNNLLTIITGNIDSAARLLAAQGDTRAQRALESAMNGAERAASLTQRLLAFARRQPLAPRAVDAGRLVAGMSDMLNRALGETVRLGVVAADALWRVEADPNQLESAILNLAVNARDAMPGGGRLTIETANQTVTAAQAALHDGFQPGDYVMIAVTDTGAGMSREVISRAFEPFFTTKEVGRGTGLGLSQVYGFVKQSGGYVMIISEPGHGATVRIYLPRLPENALSDEAAAAAPPVAGAARRETILVAEDDNDVRAFTVACLGELGYTVLEASHGEAALQIINSHSGRVDLLFTDMVMPGMSGRELAAAARLRLPGLKVLYTTGYTRDAVTQPEPGVDMIGKPFTYAALAAKLRKVLERSALYEQD